METESKERIQYTKEEFAQKVHVPAGVEQDLKRIISDRLEQCGLYFRVFSRIKSAASMEKKFAWKQYGEGHLLQDLVGVRINLYFDDDVDICRGIMENTFELIEWSASTRSEDEFKPVKMNGVFRLPEYLKAQISPQTWQMCIDDTFEIQIKTMFLEGWHEIEHDMRYKGEELWKDHSSFSRFFNSILATLELCDKSMISLFEDLGHELYKSGNWVDMIRSHFRLKMGDTPLYPEVEAVLDEDQKMTVDSLAKRIFKTSKPVLVEQLLKRQRRIPINVNTIIALLNDGIFHDARLTAIFRQQDVYNDGRDELVGESRHYEMKPLERSDVFRIRVQLTGNRLKDTEEYTTQDLFDRCCAFLYEWLIDKYGTIFTNVPSELCSWRMDVLGYHALVEYDREKLLMKMHVRHIDLEVGGRIWYCETLLEPGENGEEILYVRNGYAQPQPENSSEDYSAAFFSYPGCYKMIADNIGVSSGISCSSRRRIIHSETREDFIGAVRVPDNHFPMVLIISEETEEGMLDEGWLGQFRVSDFTRTVWRYAHVFTCYAAVGRQILKELDAEPDDMESVPGLYLFWPDGTTDHYGPEDVANCSFGRHLEARDDARTYDIVHGGQAFYHKIVTDIREWNVSWKLDFPEMV